MKTKAQIVQELLEKNQITAEEAVTLLMSDYKYPQVHYIPYPILPAYPVNPAWPYSPITISGPTSQAIMMN